MADYQGEFKTVRMRVVNSLSEGITIRLDPETLVALRAVAKEKGIGPTTLARLWIRERLRGTGHSTPA